MLQRELITSRWWLLVAVALIVSCGWTRIARAQTTSNNEVTINCNNYACTAAGIQAALNAVNQNVTSGNAVGGVVFLPAEQIFMGSTINIPSYICLEGQSTQSSWLSYTGNGSAIQFSNANGVSNACLENLTVNLNGAGANAIGIDFESNFNNGEENALDKIEEVTVTSGGNVESGQIGINLRDNSSGGQPLPSGNQLSLFEHLFISNMGQPIVTNGEEGNFWGDLQITGFYSTAVSDNYASDNYWQLRVTGPASTTTATAFYEYGRMNHINMTCDYGDENSGSCVEDVAGKNIWNVSAISPVGTVQPNSHATIIGAQSHNLPTIEQTSDSAVLTTGCLGLVNSSGTSGMNYVTALDGALSINISLPGECP
jgi:hypothetical protein